MLGDVVADHLDEIADLLGVEPAWLSSLNLEREDGREQLAPILAAARVRHSATRRDGDAARREGCAVQLTANARWVGDGLELSVARLFALASCARSRVVRFETTAFDVHVNRALIVRARPVLTRFSDLTASLDAEALHLRWREGRGAFHHRCPPPPPRDEPAFVVRFDCPRAARPPVLLAEVLRDLGLTA